MNSVQRSPNGRKVGVISTPSGQHLWIHGEPCLIPIEVAALASGKDAWIAEIKARCKECGQFFPLRELYQDLPGHCAGCSSQYYDSLNDAGEEVNHG